MSNLSKALAVVSLLTPATGQPLSIGDIELHSALNQNLKAEIKLKLDSGESLSDIIVRMASPEKFDKANIPWSYFLSKLVFETMAKDDGTVVVKVTSKDALTEPFLDFLLQVSTPQSTQYREFTLLIDPPSSYEQPVIPFAKSNPYRAEPIREPREQIERFDQPVKKTRAATARSKHTERGSEISANAPTGGEYGPVQNAATLWSIAAQLGRERGVPANQMMHALFKANPEAFNRNDINSLKLGAVLRIPETDAILNAPHQPRPLRGEQKPAQKEAVKPLELLAPTESKITDNVAIKSGKTADEASAPSTVVEAGKSAELKDLELQSRIEKLEKQLSMMQELLALKDQQLAAIQESGKPPTAPAPPLPATEKPAAPSEQQSSVEKTQRPSAVQQPVTEKPVAPAPVVRTPAPPPVVKPLPAPVATTVQDEGLFSSQSYYITLGVFFAGLISALSWLLWRKRKIEEQINNDSMFASASQLRMSDSESSLAVPVLDLDSSAAYDVGTVGESSFISDFTPSDFSEFDTDQNEVDPLSEADVYLAYGRYQQAEELMRNALQQETGKDAYKLKLLEIYYASENKAAFTDYAQELALEGKQADHSFWAKVSEMAKELAPDLTLGGTTTSTAERPAESQIGTSEENNEKRESATVEVVTAVDLPDADAADLDLRPAQFETNDEFTNSPEDHAVDSVAKDNLLDFDASQSAVHSTLELDTKQDGADDHSLDFNMDFSLPVPEKAQSKTTDTLTDIESIDFDLSDFSFDDFPEKSPAESGHDTIETFDFSFEPTSTQKSENTDAAQNVDLDFDLGNPLHSEAEPEIEITAPSDSADDEEMEFDFNFDFDTSSLKTDRDENSHLGVSDLTDMDEFETKIDLAKAYVDMGDEDAAKSIAEEVLQRGSKEQQAVAQAFLDELK